MLQKIVIDNRIAIIIFIKKFLSYLKVPNLSMQTLFDNFCMFADERKTLLTLRSNSYIVILLADKGSTTLSLNKDDYLTLAKVQLTDSATYCLIFSINHSYSSFN